LLPNNPPLPKVAPVVELPNNPEPTDALGAAAAVVDPKALPPPPNVEVLPPAPKAPNPVAGLAPPNSEFVVPLLFGLANAPIDESQIKEEIRKES
jgi:hypothetical protein